MARPPTGCGTGRATPDYSDRAHGVSNTLKS
jgi:hypothetical protein